MVNGDTDDPRELHAGTRQEGYLGGAWGATKRKEVMSGCVSPRPGAQGGQWRPGPEAQISQLLGQLS